jgi:hypothetical protein
VVRLLFSGQSTMNTSPSSPNTGAKRVSRHERLVDSTLWEMMTRAAAIHSSTHCAECDLSS